MEFEVKFKESGGLEYIEGERRMFIEAETINDPSRQQKILMIKKSSINCWNSPHEQDAVNDQERERIYMNAVRSCNQLGWAVARPKTVQPKPKMEKTRLVLPAFRLTQEPLDSEGREFLECCGGAAEAKHQLGGTPAFINTEYYPKCQGCGEEMTFYAQLDSSFQREDLADSGMIYVFVCFDCCETEAYLDSY